MTAIIMSPFPPLLIHLLSVLSIFNLSTMIESTASLLTRTCKLLGWVSAYTHALHCVKTIQEKDVKKLDRVAQWITDLPPVHSNPLAKPTY